MAELPGTQRGRGTSDARSSLARNDRGLTSARRDGYFFSWRSWFALERQTDAVSSRTCFVRGITMCLGLQHKTMPSTFIGEEAYSFLNYLVSCVLPVLSLVPSTHAIVLWELRRENIGVSTYLLHLNLWWYEKRGCWVFIILFKLSFVTRSPEIQTSCSVGGSWNCKALLIKSIFFSICAYIGLSEIASVVAVVRWWKLP